MLTNRMNLPASVVAAVTNDPYTRGDSDVSVTQLIAPQYQIKLRNEVEVVEDAADRIWSLLGQAVHSVLERAYGGRLSKAKFVPREFVPRMLEAMLQAGCSEEQMASATEAVSPDYHLTPGDFYRKHGWSTERRVYAQMGGLTVSGQYDVIEHGVLQDFKVTTVWSVIGDHKEEWEQQLNLLRLLAHHNGIEVEALRIVAILRDWSKGRANTADYPSAQAQTVDIPLWSLDRAEKYMLDRVRAHTSTNPPVCSDAERWKKEDVYAVMKEGRKSAIRLHSTSDDAEAHLEELGKGHSVVLRPGEYTRCFSYCNVSHACPAFKPEVGF